MMPGKPPYVEPGDPIAADSYNDLIDLAASQLGSSGPNSTSDPATGTHHRQTTSRDRIRWCVITDEGPDAEADFNTGHYWVVESDIDDVDPLTDDPATEDSNITTSASEDPPRIYSASNLLEQSLDVEIGGIDDFEPGPHLVPKGTRVLVRHDIDALGNMRRSFSHPMARSVWVLVSSAASGGGKYLGKLLVADPESPVSESGNLTDEDMGRVPEEAEDCLICNDAERGKATHDLTEGTQNAKRFPGVLSSRMSTSGKHVVYLGGAYDFEDCSTGGSTSEASYY